MKSFKILIVLLLFYFTSKAQLGSWSEVNSLRDFDILSSVPYLYSYFKNDLGYKFYYLSSPDTILIINDKDTLKLAVNERNACFIKQGSSDSILFKVPFYTTWYPPINQDYIDWSGNLHGIFTWDHYATRLDSVTFSNPYSKNYTDKFIYALKINNNGSVAWLKTFKGNYNISTAGYSVLDKDENMISAGMYAGSYGRVIYITNDSGNITDSLKGGFYILKHSSDGKLLWYKSAYLKVDDYQYAYKTDLATDHQKNIYISGWSGDTFSISNFSFKMGGTKGNCFILKLDSNGTVQWLRLADKGYIEPIKTACDNKGNLYIAANIYLSSDTIVFNNVMAIKPHNCTANIILKLDSSGHGIWAQVIYPQVSIVSLEITNKDDVYVFGNSNKDSLIVDSVVLFDNPLHTKDESDFYIAKYSSGGKLLAAKLFGGSEDDYILNTFYGKDGEINITGKFYSKTLDLDGNILNNKNVSTFYGTFDPDATFIEESIKQFYPLKIYPNPSNNGFFTVESDDIKQTRCLVKVYDQMGRSVYETQTKAIDFFRCSINLPDIAKGIYVIKVIPEKNNILLIGKVIYR